MVVSRSSSVKEKKMVVGNAEAGFKSKGRGTTTTVVAGLLLLPPVKC